MFRPIFFALLTLFLITGLLFLQHDLQLQMHQLASLTLAKNKSVKYVLYWTRMFSRSDFYLGTGADIFKDCPYTNCFTTADRRLMSVEEFDAILFHGVEYRKLVHGVPEKRSQHQVYVFSDQESPENTENLDEFRGFFNWTMTYRADSDVIRPYGYVRKKKTGYRPPSVEEIRRRKKKIAWFVSNCHTSSDRFRLYEKLKQFLPIDVYGKCGSLVCSRKNEEECWRMLERDYKFYLSFENSICEGYVTEKMYNILKRNVIPIVYGGANYTKIAPPKSVINVMDFTSVDQLVKYITHLDEDYEEYLKFFDWKKDYVVDTSSKHTLCTLCQKLNEEIHTKVYKNIHNWWFENKCSGNKFLKKFLQ